MKITEVPAQMLFEEGFIVILTGSTGFTVMVTVFDVAGLPMAHNALDVNVQETVLPFAGV